MKYPVRVSMLIHPLVLVCAGSAAHAQSGVSLYGIADAGIRYVNNANAEKGGKLELSGGALTGSRFGLRGAESLGGGLLTFFQLEGASTWARGHRSRGRPARATRKRVWGQRAPVRPSGFRWHQERIRCLFLRTAIFGQLPEHGRCADLWQPEPGYADHRQQVHREPARQCSQIRREVRRLQCRGRLRLRRITGNTSANSAAGVALGYATGGASVGLNYTAAHSAEGREARRTLGVTGGYARGPFKATLGYLGNRYKTAETRNDVFIGGLSYRLSGSWD